MDRMTRKTELGNYVLKSCVDCKYKDECGGYDVDCEYYLVRELGRLEDKIESGELVDTKEKAVILLSRGDGKSFMRLEVIDILTKYKNGKLVELPCKVGDKIWFITMIWRGKSFIGEIYEANVEAFHVLKGLVQIEDDLVYELHNYGEDVFLTKAEAEAKLKELREV